MRARRSTIGGHGSIEAAVRDIDRAAKHRVHTAFSFHDLDRASTLVERAVGLVGDRLPQCEAKKKRTWAGERAKYRACEYS